jgi:hypothetical protein
MKLIEKKYKEKKYTQHLFWKISSSPLNYNSVVEIIETKKCCVLYFYSKNNSMLKMIAKKQFEFFDDAKKYGLTLIESCDVLK